ncbi:probable insulin-like peptide 3 [Eupeodes corollae]|uniref:probable insulin-like peptide 3 n=1 Tax=Eupeodes corollae TaxID=290404 RepID=UPI002493A512|nr:probable insulin-like peptide 3 [Eupeodes corollae]
MFSSLKKSSISLSLILIISLTLPSCNGVQKLCGKKLNYTLALICRFGYGAKLRRSIEPLENVDKTNEDDDSPQSDDAIAELPFFKKFQMSALAKIRRKRNGIADECCLKPCTISELRLYCKYDQ